VGLVDEGRLPVQGENVVGCKLRGRQGRWPRRIVEAVVEPQAELLFREPGADALARQREVFAERWKTGPEIFAANRPVRRELGLDAGTYRPPEAPDETVFDIAGRILRQLLLIIGPGQPARGIEQPM